LSADQLGWYYFNGQLRYKDGLGWTDRYKAIEGPGAKPPPSNGKSSDHADAPTSPGRKHSRRRSYLLATVWAGLLGLGVTMAVHNPDTLHGWVSLASDRADQAKALILPQPISTSKPLTAPGPRDVNAFAPGGPPAATVPLSYNHPSPSDCLKFRDQVRAWSDFQNAHRPSGFTKDLPSSGDVQYLHTACNLGY
jgi:hypothetical protein